VFVLLRQLFETSAFFPVGFFFSSPAKRFDKREASKTKARRNTVSQRCPMIRKHGKWFADWKDENGKRKRKALKTKHAALTYQTQQRNKAAAKKDPPTERPSRPSSKPGRKTGRSATRPTPSHAASRSK
jgi:hypothetical protein